MFERKSAKSEWLLPIGDMLRFFLFGLQCKLDVEFYVAECERVFSDDKMDQVSEKQYTFYQDRRLTVTGKVDHYEPETIWIIVTGAYVDLSKLEEQARYEIIRLRKADDGEDS